MRASADGTGQRTYVRHRTESPPPGAERYRRGTRRTLTTPPWSDGCRPDGVLSRPVIDERRSLSPGLDMIQSTLWSQPASRERSSKQHEDVTVRRGLKPAVAIAPYGGRSAAVSRSGPELRSPARMVGRLDFSGPAT